MTTYYVDPSNGSDAAAGTSVGAAWLTTQKAADTAVDGDEVRLLQTSVETITAPIDFDTNSGTVANRGIQFISYNSFGTAPANGYTIQTSTSINSILEVAAVDAVWFTGCTFDANSSATYALRNNVDGADFWRFVDCSFKNSISSNISVRGLTFWWFYSCDSHDSAGTGVSNSTSNRGTVIWQGGNIHNNAGHGVHLNRVLTSYSNVNFYRNGGDGLFMDSNSGGLTLQNCTLFKNSGNGLEQFNGGGRQAYRIVGNSFVDNGGYGYEAKSASMIAYMARFNHHYLNTQGGTDITDALGPDLITGDPLFTSTTDGSEDFRPEDGSPLDGSNINGTDIGSTGSIDPTGGGGGTVGFAL
jgi:hypothetical protein